MKKTGPVSQRMTERPGEFSNRYFSRFTENSGARLYRDARRNHFKAK